MNLRLYTTLNKKEKEQLNEYIISKEDLILPYHYINFAKTIDNAFRYTNFSLVSFDDRNNVSGYLPQWKKGKAVESIPWRDKGGPIYCNSSVLQSFIDKTKRLIQQHNCKGFIWKDFKTEYLDNYQYFINYNLSLENLTEQILWKRINNRRTIKQANKNNLHFVIEPLIDDTVKKFYKIFLVTRKRLGVPAYSDNYFQTLVSSLDDDHIKILSVYSNKELIASIIVLLTPNKATYAYGASTEKAFRLRANDFLIWNTILICMRIGVKQFDFGADSPHQKTLLRFKKKWSGRDRLITTSYCGNVREKDHNDPRYKYVKSIMRNLPMVFYKFASYILINYTI